MGRPKLNIDGDKVEKCARYGMPETEIAELMGCSRDTINRRFASELTKGRARMKRGLRAWQLKYAKQGNAALLIWLGKQYLGQMEPKANVEALTEEEAKELLAALVARLFEGDNGKKTKKRGKS